MQSGKEHMSDSWVQDKSDHRGFLVFQLVTLAK